MIEVWGAFLSVFFGIPGMVYLERLRSAVYGLLSLVKRRRQAMRRQQTTVLQIRTGQITVNDAREIARHIDRELRTRP